MFEDDIFFEEEGAGRGLSGEGGSGSGIGLTPSGGKPLGSGGGKEYDEEILTIPRPTIINAIFTVLSNLCNSLDADHDFRGNRSFLFETIERGELSK